MTTNVVRLEPRHVDFGLDNSGCDFPVSLVTPYIKTGSDSSLVSCSDHRFIVGYPHSSPSPQVYECVSKNYGLVKHNEVFGAVESSIRDKLRYDYLKSTNVIDSSGYIGRDWARKYVVEGLAANPDGRSPICFTIFAKHSYGKGAIKVMFGEMRLICTNGLVSGEYECIYRRHSSKLEVSRLPELFKHIDDRIETFMERMRFLEVMGKHPLNVAGIEDFLIAKGFSERRAKALYEAFIMQHKNLAHATILEFYHFMTFYASHNLTYAPVRNTGNDNAAMTLLQRQIEVGKIDIVEMDKTLLLAA